MWVETLSNPHERFTDPGLQTGGCCITLGHSGRVLQRREPKYGPLPSEACATSPITPVPPMAARG